MTEAGDDPRPQVDLDAAKRVQELTEGYLEALQAGKAASARELIDAHPELAGALARRIAFLQLVHQATLGSSMGAAVSAGNRDAPRDPGRVKCPHCGHVGDAPAAWIPEAEVEVTCQSCGSSFKVAAAHLSTGARRELPRAIGRFEVLGLLGRGSFGAVYKARDAELGRLVAIKVPRAGYVFGNEEEERFLREARSAARLSHPAIVQVHEIGAERGLPFIVSGYIEGRSLSDVLDGDRLDFRQAAELVSKVADALAYAHGRGVIHRDIKPGNVIVDPSGAPHLTDFGLARHDEERVTVTVEGQILGTPAYMPPEQARGDHEKVDARSDIYSLGVVLYELITGVRPFLGSRTRLIHQVLHDEPRAPRSLNDHIPRDLETVCLKAMAKEPGRRYASAAELAEDLRRYLRGEPIRARPVGALERSWRWCRRKPVVAGLTATVATLLITVAIVSSVLAVRMRSARDEQRALSESIARARDDSNERLSRLNVATGFRLLEEGDLFGSLAYFAEARRLDADKARRDEVHRLRMESVLWRSPKLYRVWFHDGDVTHAEFSPRGDRVLTVSGGKAWVREIAEAREDTPPLQHEKVLYATFGPSGSLVLTTSSSGTARLWNADTRALVAETALHDGAIPHAAFSPDGRWIVTSGADRTARVWDGATAAAIGPVLEHEGRVVMAAFSLDSTRLLTIAADKSVRVWLVPSFEPLGKPLRLGSIVNFAAFSPDGTRVATACDDNSARVWEASTWKPITPPLWHRSRVTSSVFTPDGKRVVTASWDDAVRVWDAGTGESLLEPIHHVLGIPTMALSPDGRYVLTGTFDGMVKLHDISTGRPAAPPLQHARQLRRVAFSPDGRMILTASTDTTARIWDLASGELTVPPLRAGASVQQVAFSPDGKRLIVGSSDGVAQVWDVDRGRATGQRLEHRRAIIRVAFDSGGTRILTASVDGEARVWSAATGEPLAPVMRHEGQLLDAGFSPDGLRVATAGGPACARIWDVATGSEVVPRLAHRKAVNAVSFSSDSRRVITASDDGTARVWRADTGEPIGKPLKHAMVVKCATFSRDGARIATGSGDTTARIWDAETCEPILPPMDHNREVVTVQFNGDGRRLVTASRDGTARVWDALTGRPVTPPLVHNEIIRSAAFSPDGRLVVSYGTDDTAMVWDSETGDQVTPPLAHSDDVLCAVFSPDGRRLATGGIDWAVKIWRLDPGNLPVEGETLLSNVLSGRRIDATGGFLRLSTEEFEESWRELRAKHSGAIDAEVSPDAEVSWNIRQADDCEKARNWTCVALHVGALLKIHPEDTVLRRRIAWSRGAMGSFAQAAVDYAAAVQLDPGDVGAFFDFVIARWAAGDLAGCKQACAEMLNRFAGSQDASGRNTVAWAYAVLPDSGMDARRVVDLAQGLVSEHGNNYEYANTLAAVLYRAGRLEEALGEFEQCLKLEPGGRGWDWVYLAMAHRRLGHAEEARTWLDKARAWFETELEERPGKGPRLKWPFAVQARGLLGEAEKLMDEGQGSR